MICFSASKLASIIKLIGLDETDGLPDGIGENLKGPALTVKRFDRTDELFVNRNGVGKPPRRHQFFRALRLQS